MHIELRKFLRKQTTKAKLMMTIIIFRIYSI